MVGWWTGFPYWLSVAVIGIGGILGVMYSVPLRRALVTGTDLPYPEGVAAAEVLKVGARRRRRGGEPARPRADRRLDASSPPLYFMLAKTRLADRHGRARRSSVGTGGSAHFRQPVDGADRRRPPRRRGRRPRDGRRHADHLGVHRPALDAGRRPYRAGRRRPRNARQRRVQHKARMVGAGTIGVAAIWTLLKIIGPIIAGIRSALAANRERKAGRGDRAAADRARHPDRHRHRHDPRSR